MNAHRKYIEVNSQYDTIRIVEKDKFGNIYGTSRDTHFNSGVDAMCLTLTMHGYMFHHRSSGGLVTVFEEVL